VRISLRGTRALTGRAVENAAENAGPVFCECRTSGPLRGKEETHSLYSIGDGQESVISAELFWHRSQTGKVARSLRVHGWRNTAPRWGRTSQTTQHYFIGDSKSPATLLREIPGTEGRYDMGTAVQVTSTRTSVEVKLEP